ncbi:MAG: AbgT family transporter [Thermoanaerobaculia bacterium]|nr:AbgT family transporter [Thermoanaerobaculia bacterium]
MLSNPSRARSTWPTSRSRCSGAPTRPRHDARRALREVGASAAVASDAGDVILPALPAALFHAVGCHPVAGLATAFASSSRSSFPGWSKAG